MAQKNMLASTRDRKFNPRNIGIGNSIPETCLASRTLHTLKKQTNLFPISFLTQIMAMEFKEWVRYIYGPKDTSEEQNTDITNGGDLDL